MDPDHLLQLATDLAEINPRRPRRTDLCRAVSTAYYAMFHCLASNCADRLAGRAGAVGNRSMWRRVYRAPEHRQAKARCESMPSSFPASVRHFGRAFATLQEKRHFADYDPDYRIGKSEVVTDIHRARTAIDRFLEAPANIRRDFALQVLTKVRADG